jgi:hypothetical protein
MTAVQECPVRVDATLDGKLLRWLWLARWLLVIPPSFVLTLLRVGAQAGSTVELHAGARSPGLRRAADQHSGSPRVRPDRYVPATAERRCVRRLWQ